MSKNKGNPNVVKLLLVLLIIVVVGLVVLYIQHSRSANILPVNTASQQPPASGAGNNQLCAKYSVPQQSCARATAAGAYCPSWDAKPGEVAPQYCVQLR